MLVRERASGKSVLHPGENKATCAHHRDPRGDREIHRSHRASFSLARLSSAEQTGRPVGRSIGRSVRWSEGRRRAHCATTRASVCPSGCVPGCARSLYLHGLMNFVHNYRAGLRREPRACAHCPCTGLSHGSSGGLLTAERAPRLHNRQPRRRLSRRMRGSAAFFHPSSRPGAFRRPAFGYN